MPETHRTKVAVSCGQRPRHTRRKQSYCSRLAVTHHISWAAARDGDGPSKHVGRVMGTADVVGGTAISGTTPHVMCNGPARPVKTRGPLHGPGGEAHIEPTSHGPRPGPAHHFFRGWGAARPSPPRFQFLTARPGLAHLIFQTLVPARPIKSLKFLARPGLAPHIKKNLGSAPPGQMAHDKP